MSKKSTKTVPDLKAFTLVRKVTRNEYADVIASNTAEAKRKADNAPLRVSPKICTRWSLLVRDM